MFALVALSTFALAEPQGLSGRLVEHRPQFREHEFEDEDHDAFRVEVKAFVKDKDFNGHRQAMRRGDNPDRFDDRDDRVFKEHEGENDNHDAVRVEVKAFVKDKDFNGHRQAMRRGDNPDRFDDRDDRVFKEHEGENEDHDAVRVEVKAFVKDKDFNGHRAMRRGDDPDRFDDRDDRVFKEHEGENEDRDAVRVEVKAFVKDKDFNGHRAVKRGEDNRERQFDDRDDRVFREQEGENDDHDAVRIEVKAFVKDKDFNGHRREMWRADGIRDYGRQNGNHMRGPVFREQEGEDDEKDAVRIEVKAYIKDKDFEGHRMEKRAVADNRCPEHCDNFESWLFHDACRGCEPSPAFFE